MKRLMSMFAAKPRTGSGSVLILKHMSQYDSNSEKASGWMSTAGILTANDSSWKYSFPSKVLSMKGLFSIHPSLFRNCFRKATQLENICYVLRNISTMEDRPKGLEGEIFDLLFNSAEIVNFAPMERDEYYYEMRA